VSEKDQCPTSATGPKTAGQAYGVDTASTGQAGEPWRDIIINFPNTSITNANINSRFKIALIHHYPHATLQP